ncbi:DUF748 domain-containing protein [Candidatus Nitrospira nitrificans]|uniref:DUF748 domain-containing protein n=1 Tax=Candidatus Nitrospira nitrificans TaxID=1742973 RepID=A0A0S4L4F0_9BACT|nr:DUF748 domain-containing protein [Candidatus Nitrospira nitrificans]CUS32620.1 conserved hypothetical protein [Candidatus Nitrospira nitrificans]
MRRILRPRVLIGILLGLLTLYTLVGFFLLPYLITSYVIPTVSDQIKHPVVLREAVFNPFALSLRLTGLEVRGENETPILGFEELVVNLRATTLLLQKVAFDEIRLVMPFVAAKVNREGKLNLMSLVPPPDEAPQPPAPTNEPKKMMPVQIDLLEIGQGIIEYRDDSKARPVVIDVVPFEIVLRNFSTVQAEGGESAHAFTAEIGKGEKISWEGTIFLEPVESDGRVNLSGIKLKTLYQVVHDLFQFDIPQGTIGLSASYHFDLRGQAPQATVKNGHISIQNLAIVERGGLEPVISIPAFDVGGIQLDLQKQTIEVAKVHSADARFEAWMDQGGVINYQTLFTPVGGDEASNQSSTAQAKPEQASKPWTIVVDEVALRNYRAAFEDRTLSRPGHVDVSAMNLTVKDVQIPFRKPLPVDLALKLNETGTIGVQGKVTVEPLVADATLKLEHIEIQPFQPYFDRFLNADVQDGAIDLRGSVHFAKAHPNEPMLRFQGDLAVNQLAVVDRKEFDNVLTWKRLAVNRVALDVEPTAVNIAEVVWQEPSVQMVVEADGQLNLAHLAASPPSGDQAAPTKELETEKSHAKPAEPVPVTIDQVKLIKLAARFQDLSIEPNVKASLTEFGGTVKGLSSKQLKKADVNLSGKVGRAAPLKIVGTINPLSEDAFTDLVITLGGMDLIPAGPYSGKYAGYGLSKGKLSLDLKYKVSQKVLEAENLVHVDQLTFGDKTNSPDATSLPVPLIVGLLKDRKGVIEVDMPIRGNLNDPDFKYGKVVISTLLNLLGKVVASPFALMGKLVPGGGSEEDLQFIEFQPGSALLADTELTKLEALEKALDERAGLRLDIRGTTDATRDVAVLQTMKLRAQLFEMSGEKKPDQEELSPKEEQRLVEKLYAKLPAPDPSVASAEPAQPTVEGMKRKLAAAIQISPSELEELARRRAEAIRSHLLEGGKLTEERVALLDTGSAESGHEKVRTQLSLSAGL